MMRQITKRPWLLIINALVSAFVGLLANRAASAISSLSPWISLVCFLAGTVLITVLSSRQSAPDISAATVDENRQRMLNLVKNIWITGFLENPLYYSHDRPLLSLPLRKSVGSSFDLVLSDPFTQTRPISSGTTITQVFLEQAGGELLILGDPGAGKTTLLLELAHDLLQRARPPHDEAPIPVVLTLSSWATKQLPLEQWVVEELKTKYQVTTEIGQAWVKADQLLLLLDGLDEVAPDALPACIDAINAYYHQAHRSLVVCSRTKEFLDQPGRLALHTAVIVQPFSSEQIDTHLDSLVAKGEDVEGLKRALHQNEDLRKLATTSLFLTVLVLAYHGKPVQELLALMKATPKDQPHLIFHNYVERMLQRKGTRLHVTAQQTKHWLGWLAHQLTDRHQTELYLEYLQPDWLPEKPRSLYHWNTGLLTGLLLWLPANLAFGLPIGLFFGLLFGLLFGLGFGKAEVIAPLEAFSWSWRRALIGLGLMLTGFLCLGLFIGLIAWLSAGYGLSAALALGLAFGSAIGLIYALFYGLSPKELPKDLHLSPNEGIRRSATVGLVVMLFLALSLGLIGGLFGGLAGDLPTGLGLGLFFGLLFGMLFGVFVALGPAIQHGVLRLWLWRAGCTPAPRRYVSFLDDTVEQLLFPRIAQRGCGRANP